MPPKGFRAKRKKPGVDKKRADALFALKLIWEEEHENETFEPEKEPIVSPMLRAAEGGIDAVLEALRAHDDPDARSFVAVYDDPRLGKRRQYLNLEAVAFVSGIGSLRLAELAQTALFLYGQLKTKLLVSSSMHKVMASTIKAATDEVPIVANMAGLNVVVGKTNGDVKAMEMFHKISGMMPVPKGAQIAILNNNSSSQPENAPTWMDSGQRLREIHDLTDQKRLPAPVADAIQFGGRLDSMHSQTAEMVNVLATES